MAPLSERFARLKMRSGSSVRAATERDLADIHRLICSLEAMDLPLDRFTRIFTANVADRNIGYFVAQVDAGVVGFGSIYIASLLHHCGNVAEIQELVVSTGHRGAGMGRALVDAMQAWAAGMGAMQVEVTCNLRRSDAHRFYRSLGFEHTHKKFVRRLSME